jgi:alkylated DNA repair dioxygenase AlkB
MGSPPRRRAAAAIIVAAAVVRVPLNPRGTALAPLVDALARWRRRGSALATVFESRLSALAHAPRFYDRATADAMFDEISQYAGLNFTSYLIEGARVRSPRRMMWCADDGVGEYRFSANHVPGLRAHTLTPTLRRMRRDVEKAVGAPFNAVLINLYADGTEHAAWHSDDDPWLGRDFDVPSLSLGAARPFRVRRRGGVNETTVMLGHGSLLVMKGAFQREYEHSLPRVTGAGVRINLTWRHVMPALRHLHNLKPRWDSDAPLLERLGDQHVPSGYFDDNRGRDR